MRRPALVGLVGLLSLGGSGAFAADTLRPVGPQDLIEAAHAPAVSLKGWLAGPDPAVLLSVSGSSGGRIEAVRLRDGQRRLLAEGSDARPSADGRAVYFVSRAGGLSRVLAAGGPVADVWPEELVAQAGHGAAFAVDEAHGRVFLVQPPAPLPKVSARAASTVTVIRPAADPRPSEVVVLDLKSRVRRTLGAFPWEVAGIVYSPSDDTLVIDGGYTDFNNPKAMFRGRVVRMNAQTGASENLADTPPLGPEPQVRPTSPEVALVGTRTGTIFPVFMDVELLAPGKPPRRLTDELFAGRVRWGAGGELLATGKSAADPLATQIYRISPEGTVTKLTSGLFRYGAPVISPDGKVMAATRMDVFGNLDIVELRGGRERLISRVRQPPAGLALGSVERVQYRSRDGAPLSGLLIKPAGWRPGDRHPVLVELHGGPSGGTGFVGQVMAATPLEWHYWADRGYVVFVPEYRGSAVWGYEGVERWRRDGQTFRRDAEDVLDGVDAVVASGVADPARLGLLGFSHGAALTNWIVTHDNRFAAGVSLEGWAESTLNYGTGQRIGGNPAFEWEFGGPPWEKQAAYSKGEAIRFVKGVRTPMLFMSAELGVPAFSNEYLYTAWLRQGLDTQLLKYAGEGHLVSADPNRLDLLERVTNWLERHIPGA